METFSTTTKTMLLAAVLAVTGIFSATASAAVVAINGSFETETFSPYGTPTGWTGYANPPYSTFGCSSTQSENGIKPDGENAGYVQHPGVKLAWNISGMEEGVTYAISFYYNASYNDPNSAGKIYMANAGAGDPSTRIAEVFEEVLNVTPVDGFRQRTKPWYYAEYTFTAQNAGDYQLVFECVRGIFVFDNVAINVVPEPTTLGLLALSSAALLLRRNKH